MEERKEKALLVGVAKSSRERWDEADRLEELALLVETAGAEVFEKVLQVREKIDPRFYIGKGKAYQIREIVEQFGIDLVVFDTELTPSQVNNLEEIIGVKVLDRTEVIMDIFAQHARTSEAKIQVELAQLMYRLPRLTGKGLALSRLGGGIGTRGPGEKKLEVDRRRILDRIHFLKQKLKTIERSREIQRKRRQHILKVSLVGYTNAGKSSIMNCLTRAHVRVEDKLFATLDATTRVLFLPDFPYRVVLSDTVGFIENLPPDLVASFHATLGVVREADLLLHVIDITCERLDEKIQVVEDVLKDLGAGDKPLIRVFNKIDMLLDRTMIEKLADRYENSVFVSALSGENIDGLIEKIKSDLEKLIPYGSRTVDLSGDFY